MTTTKYVLHLSGDLDLNPTVLIQDPLDSTVWALFSLEKWSLLNVSLPFIKRHLMGHSWIDDDDDDDDADQENEEEEVDDEFKVLQCYIAQCPWRLEFCMNDILVFEAEVTKEPESDNFQYLYSLWRKRRGLKQKKKMMEADDDKEEEEEEKEATGNMKRSRLDV